MDIVVDFKPRKDRTSQDIWHSWLSRHFSLLQLYEMENGVNETQERRLQRQTYAVLSQLHEQLSNSGRRRIDRHVLSTFIRAFLKEHSSSPNDVDPEEILAYMKRQRFVQSNRRSVAFKMVFISEGVAVDWLFPPVASSSRADIYFICQICSKGFPSCRGLVDHQRSVSHVNALEAAIDDVTLKKNEYCCPLYGCDYRSPARPEVVRHLKQEKTKKFDTVTSTAEDIDSATVWTCNVCSIKLPIALKDQHCNGRKHRGKESLAERSGVRQRLMEDKEDVRIQVEGDGNSVIDLKSSKTLKFRVKNVSTTSEVIFESCALSYEIPSVILSDQHNLTGGGVQLRIPARAEYEVELNVKPACTGITVLPVIFSFRRDEASFQTMVERSVECVNDSHIYALLQPTKPYERPKKERTKIKLEKIESDFFPDFENNSSLLMPLRLDSYCIPSKIKELLRRHASEETIMKELNLNDLDFSNYSDYFNNLIHLEEFQQKIDIDHYTLHDVTMRMESKSRLIKLKVPGLAENRPSVLRGDHLYAVPSPGGTKKYQGHVHNVSLTEVFLGFAKSMRDSFIDKMKYKIEFTINRFPIKLTHRAALWGGDVSFSLQDVLFPNPAAGLPPLRPETPARIKLKFRSSAIESNEEQKTAVQHIVCGTSRPAPYLIYGPPGTGKTFTLVEAIKQVFVGRRVYREFPQSRILACAPQNAAADLITKHLLAHVDKGDMLRVNASSRHYRDMDDYPMVKEVSNYKSKGTGANSFKGGDKEIWFPAKEELEAKRVIIATLVTSGRFVSAEMMSHFTHIFIDEAGHATEPETVIPLARLLDINMSKGGQVVLAGDPKQLGPVIRSRLALKGGLGVSLLERLMSSDVYQRDPRTKSFNPTYVTKLVQSFRSHPAILKVPNECFYDAELQVYADKENREKFCGWEGLPTKGFPLIFHGVNGQEQREESSPSWFNINEVDEVQKYVRLLMDCRAPKVSHKQIGIISPYHQQVKKIGGALKQLEIQNRERRRNYDQIKVGSVEKFQGDEKEIIIITTVRSQQEHLKDDTKFNLGFVKNPKRFNVAITRAKALLIVIGNPAILGQDPNWKKMIQHIRAGGGYTGCPLPDDFDSDETVSELDMESLSLSNGHEDINSDGDKSAAYDDVSSYMRLTNQAMVRTDA